MLEKNYEFKDTVGKTLKANKCLVKANNKLLFDFDLLDIDIPVETVERIKNDCLKHGTILNRFHIINEDIENNFEYICGNMFFKATKVYSNSKNKYLYTVMELVKYELYHYDRRSVYDDYKIVNEYKKLIGDDYNIYEYEID